MLRTFCPTNLNLSWVDVGPIAPLLVTGYRKFIAKFRYDPDLGCSFLRFFLASVLESFTEAALRMMEFAWLLFLLAAISVAVGLASRVGDARTAGGTTQLGGLLGV